jgi:AraC family transcriptional regulator
VSVTAKALWYIESHLNLDVSLDEIAEALGVSRFHLSRTFAASAGIPLAEYMRGRRLSEAAKDLAGGASDILSVALDAGYGSHEAFTRAFRQHFGLTPEQLRAQGRINGITLQEPKRMDQKSTTSLQAPRLVKGDALLIFGLGQHYQRGNNAGIPSQWNGFVPHLGHISGQVGDVTYGVICNSDDAGNFDYICAVEVKEFPAHPPEFTRLRIAPQTYAVFDHTGHITAIASTIKAIWEHGLADAGFKAVDAPSFERYDDRFNPRTGFGGLEIWVPVNA